MLSSPTRSTLISGFLHGTAIVVVLALTGVKPPIFHKPATTVVFPSDVKDYLAHANKKLIGGGGGGANDPNPASVGAVPRFAPRQFTQPLVKIENKDPVFSVEPTLVGDSNIRIEQLDYTLWGSPNGSHGVPSGGPGKCCGIGNGPGDGGIGDDGGQGLGPGKRGDGVTYNGAARGSVVRPVLIAKNDPEYSEDARKAKLQGTVVLHIEVGTDGRAQNITVQRSLGLGLDERAMEAVRNWKFKPGTINGKPAVVEAIIEVNFRLL
jgi:periplasmic protein TonB